jgi:uncharacterized protein
VRPRTRAAAAALLGLLAAACGRKGTIRPPLVLVPQPVENFRASQQGDRIVLQWSNPTASIDGSPLTEIGGVEIWSADRAASIPAGAVLLKFLSADEMKALPVGGAAGPRILLYSFVPEGKDRFGKPLALAVRVRDARRKRWSEFSPAVAMMYVLVPGAPRDLRASAAENRVELRWAAPPANIDGSVPAALKGYNVYRAEAGGPAVRLNGKPFPERAFDDTDFIFGKTYSYVVRASVTGEEPFAEGADSAVAVVTPKDVFPPAVPTGLTAAAGGSVIMLLWEAGREPDLAGYRVWRRVAGRGSFEPLTARPVAENTYSDAAAAPGVRFEYAVSAVDKAGNESARSAAVSEILKEPRP